MSDTTICPGCENEVAASDGVDYYGDVWHKLCAREDSRINRCIDAQDKYYHEFDE